MPDSQDAGGLAMSTEPLPHLDTFLEAAERGSFTAAATALGLTQAAVSQRMQALEKELQVALFRREGGRITLTEAGRRLHAYAQQIADLYRVAREAVTGVTAPLRGELDLAASSVPGEHLLPKLLGEFRHRHPHITVKVKVADSQAVIDMIEQGEAHLGLVGVKEEKEYLEYRCFACDQLVLVVPPGHPWSRRQRVTLAELQKQSLILREKGSGSRWCLEHALEQAKQPMPPVTLELGSNEAIKEAVLGGLGLAVLSRHAVEHELESGRLHAVQIRGLALEREIFVVHDRRRALPIPARLFLDLLEPCPGGVV